MCTVSVEINRHGSFWCDFTCTSLICKHRDLTEDTFCKHFDASACISTKAQTEVLERLSGKINEELCRRHNEASK